MPKLVAGDKIEVTEHSAKEYVGKRGEVAHVGSGFKPVTQPVVEKLPKLEEEPRYSVVLEEGGELHNLQEQQLRKL